MLNGTKQGLKTKEISSMLVFRNILPNGSWLSKVRMDCSRGSELPVSGGVQGWQGVWRGSKHQGLGERIS